MYVPFRIAKEGVEFAQGGVLSFIAPSELSVLEVDLFQLTRVEGISEAHKTREVYICTVFISSAVDLIESPVTRHRVP